jgi:uncharacterized protein YjaG (DUF416 family)
MNVYQCWYFGLKGYCCRSYNSRWMFVPEMGQSNSRIHKHISLHDLVFNNSFAKEHELKLERKLEKTRSKPLSFIMSLLFPAKKASSVGGLFFHTA